jgi:hypothetical protein
MRFQIRLTPHKLLHLSKTNLIPLHECYIRHMPYHNWCPFRVVDARGCQKDHLKAYPSHSGQKGLTFFMAHNSPLDILGATLLMSDNSYKLNNFSYFFSLHQVVVGRLL